MSVEADFAPIPIGAHDDPRLFGLSFSARGFAFLLLSRLSHRGRFSGEPRALAAQLRLVSVAAVKRALLELERCGAVAFYDGPLHGGAVMRVGEWIRYRDYRGLPANRRYESKLDELGADPYPPRAGVVEKGWEEVTSSAAEVVQIRPSEEKAKARKPAPKAEPEEVLLSAAKSGRRDPEATRPRTKNQDQSVGSPARKRAVTPRGESGGSPALELVAPQAPSRPQGVPTAVPLELPAPPKAKASPPGQLSVAVEPEPDPDAEHAVAIARWEAERARRGVTPVSRRDLLELARATGAERFALAVEDHCRAESQYWRGALKCLAVRCRPDWRLSGQRRCATGRDVLRDIPRVDRPTPASEPQVGPLRWVESTDHREVWEAAREQLRELIEPWDWAQWIGPLTAEGRSVEALVLGCPDGAHQAWVDEHFAALIEGALGEAVRLVPYPQME